MSAPAPAPHRPTLGLSTWLPSARSLLWVLGAFVVGLLLFALVLSRGGDASFYRADTTAPTSASPHYAPLPAPLPAERDSGASGMGKPAEMPAQSERPRLVETAPPAPPAMPPAAPTSPVASTQPQPVETPAPRYPSQALRQGESGTVMVRALIGAEGVPTDVEVANSSGSRQLDRAAVEAVRRWRFKPAMRDGQPTTGTVLVPISFEARR